MPTKEQLSEEVNEMLGTDYDFSRMTKNDLKRFKEEIESMELLESLGRFYVKEEGKSQLEDAVDDWELGKIASKLL